MSEDKATATKSPRKTRPPRQRVPSPGIRCTHTDAAGRQCRGLALKSVKGSKAGYTSGLCPAHATEDRQLRETDAVAEYLFKGTPALNTTAAVNHVLGKLFELIAGNRIPIRNASLLVYTASLLLNSLDRVKDEVLNIKGRDQWLGMIFDAFNTIDPHAFDYLDDKEKEKEKDSNSDSEEESGSDIDPGSGDRAGAEIVHAPDYDPESDAESVS